jgi:hypothetical protein
MLVWVRQELDGSQQIRQGNEAHGIGVQRYHRKSVHGSGRGRAAIYLLSLDDTMSTQSKIHQGRSITLENATQRFVNELNAERHGWR